MKQSTIPGAGNGRYSTEAVVKGTTMCVKMGVKMADVSSLAELGVGMAVTFDSEDGLEKYVALAIAEGGHKR